MDKRYRNMVVMASLLPLAGVGGDLCAQTLVTTPQAITVVAGDFKGAAGSLSFSGGEVAVQTSVARAITVVNVTESFTEGVQQPLSMRDNPLGVESPVEHLTVFPNPTTESVTIEAATLPLQYTLLSPQGKTLQQGTLNDAATQLNLGSYASGSYMLRVTAENGNTSLYKIILAK